MKNLLRKILVTCFVSSFGITTVSAQIQTTHLPPISHTQMMLGRLHNKTSTAHNQEQPFDQSPNAPCLNAQTTLGGSNYDPGEKIIPTKDGGFVVCGETFSSDGDFHVPAGNGGDAFVAKYNTLKKLEWVKTYGGTGDDVFNDIIQIPDGSYIAAGSTTSVDGDVKGNHGGYDVWAVKLNASGNIEWQKCFGGSNDEFGSAIVQSFYGSYAIAGGTSSNDGDVSGNHNTDGNFDAWLVRLGADGNLLTQHCYGGTDYDAAYSMVRSGDENLILEGVTESNDGDVSGNHGSEDAWVVKVNATGKIIWQRCVGGSSYENSTNNCIVSTKDGNIAIDGLSFSSDGDIPAKPQDTLVCFAAKLNAANGDIIWSKSYATPRYRFGNGLFATRDGGLVETAILGGATSDPTGFDVLISKFDSKGREDWYKRLGGSNYDAAIDGYENTNGDLTILCQSASSDGDVKKFFGNTDCWIIKLGPCGEFENDENMPVSFSQNKDVISLPSALSLSAYPNPFSGSATISFALTQSQKVSINIYDMNGRLIKTLVNEQMNPGIHQLTWNARDDNESTVASGIYLLKIQSGSNMETKKISVFK